MEMLLNKMWSSTSDDMRRFNICASDRRRHIGRINQVAAKCHDAVSDRVSARLEIKARKFFTS